MPRWLIERENIQEEWTVIDAIRDYRLYAFNHEHHGGAHVHAPLDGPVVARLPDMSAADARRIVLAYAESRWVFDLGSFEEEVERWRSTSRST